MHTLIAGCGDTGVRVAARAFAAGDRVTGIVHSAASARRVRSVGAAALHLDLDVLVGALPACDRLVYSAPPSRKSEHDARMARVLAALPSAPAHLVYISTSGVYGDCGGDWVDETRPTAAHTARARRRVDAERQIQAFAPHATILRAPGIYGPGRLPIDRILNGEPVHADAEGGWMNRVHIDDLAAMTWAAATGYWPETIYNACDGHPTRYSEYYDTLAELLGTAPPPRIGWAEAKRRFSAMRLSFLRESRRLSNARLRTDPPGFTPYFADYRQGLAASLIGEPSATSGGY